MRAWQLLGLILLLLLLVGQIRVGINAVFAQEGLSVWARLGLFKIKVFPRPKNEGKKPKTKKKPSPKPLQARKSAATGTASHAQGGVQSPEKQKKPGKPLKEKVSGGLELATRFVPLAVEAAGCLYSKLVMDELELCLTVGGTDPADVATLYGQANAALAALWEPLTTAFHVKDGHAQVRVDFDAPGTTLYGKASFSLKIGQILWLGLYFGIRALARFLGYRNMQKAKQMDRKAV